DLRQKFSKTPVAENSYLVLASWFAARNDWQKAEDTFNKAMLNLPRNTRRQQAVLGSANAKRKLGKNRDAHKLYGDFLKSYRNSPFLAHGWLGYGRAFADIENYRNALDAFKKLQEEFPNADVSIQAYGDIGNIWRTLGSPQKALSAYQTYETRVESSEEKSEARLHIARIYEDLNWYDLATESYRTLIGGSIVRYATEGQFGLAGIFEKTGQTELALREYRTYLKNYADGPKAEAAETRIQLLTRFATETDQDRAWIELLANLPAVAKDAHTQFILGKSLYAQKYYARAITHFSTAIAGEGDHTWLPEAHYFLGDSYLKQALKAALENDPNAAKERRNQGLATLKTTVEKFAESDWADDAALAVIDAETAELQPDSTRAQTQLDAYREFQKTYANSDRLHDAKLRTADAFLLGNNIADALEIYRSVQTQAVDPAFKEKATYG
ncbi:MAG: tetratricopeptide repeat protein, partial [Candidatus Latescibacteria bacterium]|nr:tetratricopeptide repeat protein [Candidatus Latescibacterota bacterium]